MTMLTLTERENAICKLRDQGMSWNEIASELGIRKGSASASFKNAMKKLAQGKQVPTTSSAGSLDVSKYLDENVVAQTPTKILALVIENLILQSRLLTHNRDKLAAERQELETALGRRGLIIINDPTSGEIRLIDDERDAVGQSH